MNFNKIVVVGNLTRDPESRTLPSGQTLASFSIATNRVWNDQGGNKQQAVEYHNIVAFGKLAEICSRYLTKGQLALVEGRIQTRSWQDQSGLKKYRTEIVAENMQMGPRREGAAASKPAPTSENQNIPQEEIPVIEAEEPISPAEPNSGLGQGQEDKEEVNVDDIPF
jgi:single-strand DNA-binding protein